MLKFSPNGDRVIIRPFKEDELRGAKFSILMPFEQDKMAAQQGIIVEAGPESPFSVGDTVVFNPAAGDILRVPDGMRFIEMRIMHADTVHCKFTDA